MSVWLINNYSFPATTFPQIRHLILCDWIITMRQLRWGDTQAMDGGEEPEPGDRRGAGEEAAAAQANGDTLQTPIDVLEMDLEEGGGDYLTGVGFAGIPHPPHHPPRQRSPDARRLLGLPVFPLI